MLLPLAQAGTAAAGTGLEWMVYLSVLLPIVVLLVIIILGSRNTV